MVSPEHDAAADHDGAPSDQSDGTAKKRQLLDDGSESRRKIRRSDALLASLPGSASASRRTALSPFLACHLTLLMSMYDDGDDKFDAENNLGDRVEEQTWASIGLFLEKRDALLRCIEKSRRLRGIQEEAKTEALSTFDGIGRTMAWHQGEAPDYAAPFSTQILPQDLTQRVGLSSPQPSRILSINSPEFSRSRAGQRSNNQESSSWLLMTRLLERKSDAACEKANLMAKEFRPLVDVVNTKISELRGVLDDLVTSRVHHQKDLMLLVMSGSVNGRHASADRELAKIVKIESKICLWQLLSESLKSTVDF